MDFNGVAKDCLVQVSLITMHRVKLHSYILTSLVPRTLSPFLIAIAWERGYFGDSAVIDHIVTITQARHSGLERLAREIESNYGIIVRIIIIDA